MANKVADSTSPSTSPSGSPATATATRSGGGGLKMPAFGQSGRLLQEALVKQAKEAPFPRKQPEPDTEIITSNITENITAHITEQEDYLESSQDASQKSSNKESHADAPEGSLERRREDSLADAKFSEQARRSEENGEDSLVSSPFSYKSDSSADPTSNAASNTASDTAVSDAVLDAAGSPLSTEREQDASSADEMPVGGRTGRPGAGAPSSNGQSKSLGRRAALTRAQELCATNPIPITLRVPDGLNDFLDETAHAARKSNVKKQELIAAAIALLSIEVEGGRDIVSILQDLGIKR